MTTILIGSSGIYRDMLLSILAQHGFPAEAATTPQQAIEKTPDLVVFTTNYDQRTIINDILTLRGALPNLNVVLLGDARPLDEQYLIAAFRAGVRAYIVNPTAEILARTLELVSAGSFIVPGNMLATLLKRVPAPRVLSGREREILAMLIRGESNKTIARALTVAEATVKVHVKGILRKIGCNNRTQAATWALTNGVISSYEHPLLIKQENIECSDSQSSIRVSNGATLASIPTSKAR